MKYMCWYKHEIRPWNGGYSMSTDYFIVKSRIKEKAEKKANKKIYKMNKKYIGKFTLSSVNEMEE